MNKSWEEILPTETRRVLDEGTGWFTLAEDASRQGPGMRYEAIGTGQVGVYVVVGKHVPTDQVVQVQAAASYANLVAVMDQFGELAQWMLVEADSKKE